MAVLPAEAPVGQTIQAVNTPDPGKLRTRGRHGASLPKYFQYMLVFMNEYIECILL
jgi:hypothetical protein